MRTYTASKRMILEIRELLRAKWPVHMSIDTDEIKIIELTAGKELLVFSGAMVVRCMDVLVPFLGDEVLLGRFPSVMIDSGAIPRICNGADLMRPGITLFEGYFNQSEVVVVRDNKYRKGIAVGLAELDRVAAEAASKGKIIKTIHHVGDLFWETHKATFQRS